MSDAIDFLQRVHPERAWVLTAIPPDRKKLETKTFHEAKTAEAWIKERNGHYNLYWHVNPTIRDLNKTNARIEDVREVTFLHVDVDPRAGEDLQAERKRIKAMLTEKLPEGVPEPSLVVFSGGGYQAFWELEEPISVGGDPDKAAAAARYNQGLEIALGADECHNVNRIMRLPGTTNIPDVKKRKKGRKEIQSKLILDTEKVYELSVFTPATTVQGETDLSSPSVKIQVEDARHLASVDELDEWNVSDRVRVIIVQGNHPDEIKPGDNSRSAWLFDACCNLIRAGVPDEVVFGIITDPGFGISESVLDKGRNASKYALRQIERAKEEVEEPWLRKLNERFAVIGNIGGRCRVVEEVMDEILNRPRLMKQSFGDFRNRFLNQHVECVTPGGKVTTKPLGDWWLRHAMRRQYEKLTFAPEREVPGAYNLWRGYAHEAKPGDCEPYLDHLKENVCQGVEEFYEYLVRWMARAVQKPARAGEVAVVLRGGRGVGKGLTARIFGELFGRHYLHVSNPSHIVGNFNAHLRDCVVLFADEAFYAGDKKHASILKTLITEETIPIEAKGVDVEVSPNYVHLIMASNDQWVVPAGGDERRFYVVDVGKRRQRDSKYFGNLLRHMDQGGYEALLHHLLTMNLEGFDVRDVPQTAALQEQKILSLSQDEEWWYRKLLTGNSLDDEEGWIREVPTKDLITDYANYMDQTRNARRSNETTLGRFLHKVCGSKLRKIQRQIEIEVPTGDGFLRREQQRAYVYLLPSLEQARDLWEELFGPQPWDC